MSIIKMEPIPFGRKRGLRVKDTIRRSQILENLRDFSSVRLWEKNGVQWTTWSYETYQKLLNTPHLVRLIPEHVFSRTMDKAGREEMTRSFDSKPCQNYFVLLTTLNDRKICCFIEQTLPLESATIIQTRFRFRDSLFTGTLFSGSLVPTIEDRVPERLEIAETFKKFFPAIKREITSFRRRNWLFLAADLWVIRGKEISTALPQRIVTLQDLFAQDWFPDPRLDICDLETVRYIDYSSMEKVIKYEKKHLHYKTNDQKIIFVPAQGSPGINESVISITETMPKTIGNQETAVFRNGEWSVQETGSGQLLEKKNKERPKNAVLELRTSNFPGVYWVFHPRTGKNLGAARIKSLEDSKILRGIFEQRLANNENTGVHISCVFEEEFMKWCPIILKNN